MRITQWGEYGVHCCVFLATRQAQGQPAASANDIAESQGIDIQYAQQILQRLRKNNIIESIRGPLGGYKLSRSAQEITLAEILQAAEGDTFEIICETKPLGIERCSDGATCSLRPIWHKLKDHINQFLSNINLQDLIDKNPSSSDCVQIGGHNK
jgi:Rrf2 family transcriptional regulator, iron-sulfur cluster assembly transcription factor